MKKYVYFLCILILFSGQATAYTPDDPEFICAEPVNPYNPDEENPFYLSGKSLKDEMIAYYSLLN